MGWVARGSVRRTRAGGPGFEAAPARRGRRRAGSGRPCGALSFAYGALKKILCGVVSPLEFGSLAVALGATTVGRGESGARVDLECCFLHPARAGVYLWRCCPRRRFTRTRAAGRVCVAGGAGGIESSLASRPGRRRPHRVSSFVAALQRTSAPFACGRRVDQRRSRGRFGYHGVGRDLIARLTAATRHVRPTCPLTCEPRVAHDALDDIGGFAVSEA